MGKEVAVEQIKPNAYHVVLVGPEVWNQFYLWCLEILTEWRRRIVIGNWAFSSTYGILTGTKFNRYILHFWFDNPSDAIIFKLSFSHY